MCFSDKRQDISSKYANRYANAPTWDLDVRTEACAKPWIEEAVCANLKRQRTEPSALAMCWREDITIGSVPPDSYISPNFLRDVNGGA